MRIAFLASGQGSNVRAVVEACREGKLPAEPVLVISNRASAPVLAYALEQNIPAIHLSLSKSSDESELDTAMVQCLKEHRVDLVLLAGYLKLLGPATVDTFSGRILNIHPALLPKFGGKGMYGIHVHRAVIAASERETGVTIHLADRKYDEGAIVAQSVIEVRLGETPEELAARVLQREHSFLVETLSKILDGRISLPMLSIRPDS